MGNTDKKEKKNKLGFVGTMMLLIDIVLLAVILVSVFKKDEVVSRCDDIVASSSRDEDASSRRDEDASSRREDALPSRDDESDKEEKEHKKTESAGEDSKDLNDSDENDDETGDTDKKELDTEGIEGIVDIEDDNQFVLPDYSTTSRPSLSDFMWYFDNVHYNGIPADATYIYDSEQMVGDWKGFIFYDPDRKMNSYGVEFLNVNLQINGQKADVVFDLYQLYFEDTEVINEEGSPNLNYSGNFENGAVYATGGGNVHIDTFYTMPDKKQYAVGYLDTPDGTPAYLALVRP